MFPGIRLIQGDISFASLITAHCWRKQNISVNERLWDVNRHILNPTEAKINELFYIKTCFFFSGSFVIICQSENRVVLNLLVFVGVKRLYVLFKFLWVCFSSATRPKTCADVDLCGVGQIYADLQHHLETDSLPVRLRAIQNLVIAWNVLRFMDCLCILRLCSKPQAGS